MSTASTILTNGNVLLQLPNVELVKVFNFSEPLPHHHPVATPTNNFSNLSTSEFTDPFPLRHPINFLLPTSTSYDISCFSMP